MKLLNQIFPNSMNRRSVLLIITAAVLIELLSGVQYYTTHNLLEEELEKRAESELTMKAILIRSTLNAAEDMLKDHVWDIRQQLHHPDSVMRAVERLVVTNRYVCGGFMAFVPDFYASKGRLFEPYAHKKGDRVWMEQIAGEKHDYTERFFYKEVLASGENRWMEPYLDSEGAQTLITSYVAPIPDNGGGMAGVAGIDISVEWLSDTINSRHIYPSSFVLLLTEGGSPIVLPTSESIHAELPLRLVDLINDSTATHRLSSSGRSTMVRFSDDGESGTIFYANMRGVPHWQIAVVCYDSEVYGDLVSLRIYITLLMLLAFGGLLYMVWRFVRNEQQLTERNLEQKRMDHELGIAHTIQQRLLPGSESMPANSKDIHMKGILIPAKAVGGDLFNAFIRDDKLFFCIGDVSGKGIPSALIMAITQTLFRNIASRENNPERIMAQLNEMACRNNKDNIFVTLFVGVLDLPSGHLRYCNAGHEKPIIIRKRDKGESEKLKVKSEKLKMPSGSIASHSTLHASLFECVMVDALPNLPIGLFENFPFKMQKMNLNKGESLFLYTDGLTEARNAQGQLLGREHVMELFERIATNEPEKLIEATINDVNAFTAGAEQTDDLTLLSFCYTPMDYPSILEEDLVLQNDVKQVSRLNSLVMEVANRLNIKKQLANKLKLAVEEAVVNVMEYAYPAGTTGDIHIHISSNGRRLKFVITDSGASFNPTEASAADTSLTAEERPVGGLGIFLVRNLMDSINYERIDGKNVLTLRKDYVSEM